MAAPTSRPLHPCILPVMEGSQGVEYSTWANIFPSEEQLPNLVTALNSSLRIYSFSSSFGAEGGSASKLLLEESFDDLSGSICYLDTLASPDSSEPDALLIGFAGHPRLGIIQVVRAPATLTTASATMLRATSLLDLTPLLVEGCMGAVTPLEQDLMATRLQTQPNSVTLAVVLGGGVAVACLSIQRIKSAHGQCGWNASEPYMLPLAELYKSSLAADQPQHLQQQPSNYASIAHGFGDILSVCFLSSYREPTLALLHGMTRTWSGRLGRPEGEGGSGNAVSLTALSLTVAHERSAVLWSTLVPADANEVHSIAKGCLVLGINTVVSINNAGRPGQVLAVNGWARAVCPTSLLGQLHPNPWPLPRLSLSLDGSKVSFVSDEVAILSLRRGALYLLQQIEELWSMIPLGQTLGALGQVSDLIALPIHTVPTELLQVSTLKTKSSAAKLSVGLFFAGSRLGDSTLMLFTMEPNVALMDAADVASKNSKKRLLSDIRDKQQEIEDEYEIMLQREEEALYQGEELEMEGQQSGPAIVPPSEDEFEPEDANEENEKAVKRAKLLRVSLVRSMTALDSLTATGPLGIGCEGPMGAAIEQDAEQKQAKGGGVGGSSTNLTTTLVGGTAQILPCGFGSSGGLALLGAPGHDERVMVAEADCLQMECLFSLTKRGLLLVGKKTAGTTIMQVKGGSLSEIQIKDWCGKVAANKQGTFEDAFFLLEEATLLYATECHDDSVLIVVRSDEFAMNVMAILSGVDGKVQVQKQEELANDMGAPLLSVTPVLLHDNKASFGCVWESGNATVVTSSSNDKGGSQKTVIHGSMEVVNEAQDDEGDEEDEEKRHYRCNRITAIDVFVGARRAFVKRDIVMEDVDHAEEDDDEDEEERELYAEPGLTTRKPQTEVDSSVEGNVTVAYVAVCRQSSLLEVFELASLLRGTTEPVWSSKSCGLGVFELSATASARLPKFHQVYTSEIRFFSTENRGSEEASLRKGSFRIVLETSFGDIHAYTERRDGGGFSKEALRIAGRPSKDSSRLHTKLRGKNMLSKTAVDDHISNLATFRHNRLHRFAKVAGKNGLFAATSRPMWFISERGSIKALHHRSRHVAPAGGSSRPVRSFCSTDDITASYVTLHERIGRVGSQRLTVFSDLPGVSSPHGMLPGGGYTIQKIPFGVTVRAIRFIDDPQVSSRSHPLYAVLVSRELEENQCNLNDDGLTPGERKRLEDEKEAAKVQRQVEADLGGFDVEQEWVEEIERENCFKVSTYLGGAPPVAKSVYSLWIVDAGNNWNVVDSYELPEFEHGMELNVMNLTEVPNDPSSNNRGDNNTNSEPPELGPDTLFVTVGTAILDADGEDVSAKGRVLLFQVKRQEVVSPTSPVAELTLVYEKDISHGPVTSLSCLECEGKSRLIIGAGADVNVEQWGKNHLTQVGFFRATMQILKIQLFKTFFLLSDAYDSLNFLVWRESDKSLTLLAKDYEPTPVYAAGFMSRGGGMSFVCHDDRQNLQFFQYAPGDAAARGGNKLVCRADIHLGAQTTGIQSRFCKSSLLVNSSTPTSTLAALKSQDPLVGKSDDDQRIGAFFGTSDGNFGCAVPLSEPVYWRLAALQSVMANALESHCSLNQRAWRLYRRTPRRGGCRSNDRRKGVIDGNLVIAFSDLSLPDQEDLASAIGSTVEMILDNLVELKCSTMVM